MSSSIMFTIPHITSSSISLQTRSSLSQGTSHYPLVSPFLKSSFKPLLSQSSLRSNSSPSVRSAISSQVQEISELKKSFENDQVKVGFGNGDLPRVVLTTKTGSSAEVYLYGGAVTSWKNNDGHEILYVRPDAVFTGKKPISGGIPHCFPQFGPGEMQQHGFARNLNWEIIGSKSDESSSTLTLKLSESEYSLAMFDYTFDAIFDIVLGDNKLSTKLTIKNTDKKPFSFTTALHTYFSAVAAEAKVLGLKGLKTKNKFPDPNNPIEGLETREEVDFPGFVDCLYLNAPSEVFLENGLNNTVKIASSGWEDVVIWNPHLTMENCYKEFVCVENAKLNSVSLAPGEEWVAEQFLSC